MKDNFMNAKRDLLLSLGTALVLMTGCGGSNGSDNTQVNSIKNVENLQIERPVTISASQPKIALLQVLRETSASDTNATVQQDTIHLLDGQTLHLVADEAAMGVSGEIVSYKWFDKDCKILSKEKVLDKSLYFDPKHNHDGMTKYVITIKIKTEDGKKYSKKYTVYVHKESLTGGQAELGPLAQANFTLRKLDENMTKLYEGITTQGDGQDVTTAGIIPVSAAVLNSLDDEYYFVGVSGGLDVDRNDDLVWDDVPTVNHGTLHAILSAGELQRGNYKVNIFTQAIYQYLASLQDVTQLSANELKDKMDNLAAELIAADLNGDGHIDYLDVLRWDPAKDKDQLTIDYEKEVAPYVEKILLGNDGTLVKEYVVDQRVEGNSVTTYTYDVHGNVITETITQNSDTGTPVITIIHYTNAYDAQGRLIEQSNDSNKRVKRWVYDAQGNLKQKEVGIYEADGSFTVFEYYYYKNGKLDTASFDRGESPYTVSYETDEYGNVIKEVVQWSGQEFVTEYSYEYDQAGHILKKYKNGTLLFEQSWKRV